MPPPQPPTVRCHEVNTNSAANSNAIANAFAFTNANSNAFANSNARVSDTGYVNVGEPINLATGNVSQLVTDYTTKGTNPLTFTRRL